MRRVAGGGRVEQALRARWQHVGGGRGRAVRRGGRWWEAGREQSMCQAGEFNNVFVYFFYFGLEQRQVGVGLFPVPYGSGAPSSERWPCTRVLRGSCGSSIALAVT